MNRIKEQRLKLKKTQDQIADMLQVNRSTYTKWENQTHFPDVESWKKLAQIFGTTTSYLLGETDNPDSDTELTADTIEYALYGTAKELDDHQKEELLWIAQQMQKRRAELEKLKERPKE